MPPDDYPFHRNVWSPLTPEMLRPLDPRCRVVQFSAPLLDHEYVQLAAFLVNYPGMPLRAYGHSLRDLEFLQFFPRLRHVVVHNYEVASFDGLRHLPTDLQSLVLGETISRRCTLGILRRFPRLRSLGVTGHRKDLDAISDLHDLERLTLRSLRLPDLQVLLPLQKLQSLTLHGTGTTDLGVLPSLARLRSLVLSTLRGLADLSPIGAVTALELLHLERLPSVTSLPSLANLTALRRLHIEQLKGLADLTPIGTAPALEELLLIGMKHLEPDDVRCLTTCRMLQRALVNLGSVRKNAAANRVLGLPFADRFGCELR